MVDGGILGQTLSFRQAISNCIVGKDNLSSDTMTAENASSMVSKNTIFCLRKSLSAVLSLRPG